MKRALLPLLIGLSPLAQAKSDTSRLDQILQSGNLRVCMTGDYRPFTHSLKQGGFEGMDVDLAKSLASSMGVQPTFVKTTWSGLMDDFIAKCDIAVGGVTITLQRLRTASFAQSHLIDGKAPIIRCADSDKFPDFAAIDQPGTRAIVNPGGTNELFARSHYHKAKLTLHPDNVTIFEEIVEGRADVMVTDASETRWQAKLHPELCPVNPDKPLQYGEKAFMLPRGDTVLKDYVDSWMRLAKASGEYQAIADRWIGH